MDKEMQRLVILDGNLITKDINKYRHLLDGAVIINFSTLGKATLDKEGITGYFPDEITELPDLNEIGINNIECVKNICLFLDKKLQEKIDYLSRNDIKLYSAAYYKIKIFFDTLYTSYYILRGLFEKFKEKEIIVFKKPYSFCDIVNNGSGIISALIENVILKKRADIKIIFCSSHKSNNKIVSYLTKLRYYITIFIKNNIKIKPYKYSGIILFDTHDISYLIHKTLKEIKFYQVYINNFFIRIRARLILRKDKKDINNQRIKEVFKDILNFDIYQKMFIDDKQFFYFTNQCLQDYLTETLGCILPITAYLRRKISDLNPKFLLTSHCRLDLNSAYLLELCHSLNIPIVTYQEGGNAGYFNWPFFNIDLDLSDYFLAYGNGVKNSPFIKGNAEVIPVGSLRLDTIRNNTDNLKFKPKTSKIKIYFVLSNISIDMYQHYPCNSGFFSQAYTHQLKIIKLLKQFDQIRVVLKTLRNRRYLYDNFAKDGDVSIETKPLFRVLKDADAFIIDYPSTILQECLLTVKPIAILCDIAGIDFEPKALLLLQKRVRFSSNPNEFYSVIKSLIEDIKYGSIMTKEKEFINNYCIMPNIDSALKCFFDNLLKN